MKRKRSVKLKKTKTLKPVDKVVLKEPTKGGLIEFIESLPKPKNIPKGDLVKLYYEDWGKRHGL